MVYDLLTPNPRPGEVWKSVIRAHAWQVRILQVSLNSVRFVQVAGPARSRGKAHWMSLCGFRNCYRKISR